MNLTSFSSCIVFPVAPAGGFFQPQASGILRLRRGCLVAISAPARETLHRWPRCAGASSKSRAAHPNQRSHFASFLKASSRSSMASGFAFFVVIHACNDGSLALPISRFFSGPAGGRRLLAKSPDEPKAESANQPRLPLPPTNFPSPPLLWHWQSASFGRRFSPPPQDFRAAWRLALPVAFGLEDPSSCALWRCLPPL